jgi:hypothetical protein
MMPVLFSIGLKHQPFDDQSISRKPTQLFDKTYGQTLNAARTRTRRKQELNEYNR